MSPDQVLTWSGSGESPAFWFIDGHLLPVSPQGRIVVRILWGLCYNDTSPIHKHLML
jgi:hypothetical protein